MKNGMLHVGENCMKKSIGCAPRDRPIRSSAFKCFDTRISCVPRSTGLSCSCRITRNSKERKRRKKGKRKKKEERSKEDRRTVR